MAKLTKVEQYYNSKECKAWEEKTMDKILLSILSSTQVYARNYGAKKKGDKNK